MHLCTGAQAAAATVGGVVPLSSQNDLLEEVTFLVEAPTVVLGDFDAGYLELPRYEVTLLLQHAHYSLRLSLWAHLHYHVDRKLM